MKNSLQKLMILTMTTTMLSGVGAYAADKEEPLVPKAGVQVPVAAPVLPPRQEKTDCSCCSSFGAWWDRTFTKKNIEAAVDGLEKVGGVVVQIGGALDTAHQADWKKAQQGLEGADKIVHGMTDAAFGADGHVTAAGLMGALGKGTAGAAHLAGDIDPSLRRVTDKVESGATVVGGALHHVADDLSGGVSTATLLHALTDAGHGAMEVAADNTSGDAHAQVEKATRVLDVSTAVVGGMVARANPMPASDKLA